MNTLTAVFQQIVSMSLTSAVVVAVLCALRLCLKKAPKKFSYWLWAAAGFRLVCPVSFSAVFSLFAASSASAVPAAGPVTRIRYLPSDYPTVSELPGNAPPRQAAPLPGAASTPAAFSWNWVPQALALLWVLGILVLLTTAAVSYGKTRRMVGAAVKLYGNAYECDRIVSPFVLGFFRPKIYLPFGLEAAQKEYVLCHEACHIKRGDHLVKPLAFLILALHWFNPLVWLAFHLMAKDMEMSCDERVLEQLGDDMRTGYSLSLLSFGANRRFPSPNPLAFGETSVKERVKNVMTFRRTKAWVSVLAGAACILVTAACSANPLEGSGLSPLPPEAPSAPETSSSPNSSPLPGGSSVPVITGAQDELDERTGEVLGLLFHTPDSQLAQLLETPLTSPSPAPESSQVPEDELSQPESSQIPEGELSQPESSPEPPASVGVIGGADGPTTVYVDNGLTEKLNEYFQSLYPAEYFTETGYGQFLKNVQANWSFPVLVSGGAELRLKEAKRQPDETTAVRRWDATVEASLPDGTSQLFEIPVTVQETDGKIGSLRLGNEYVQLQSFYQAFFLEGLRGEAASRAEELALQLEELKLQRDLMDEELSQYSDQIKELELNLQTEQEQSALEETLNQITVQLDSAKESYQKISEEREQIGSEIEALAEELDLLQRAQAVELPPESSAAPSNLPVTSPIPTPGPIPIHGSGSAEPVE